MLNILNETSVFGWNFDWSSHETVIVLIAIQAMLAVVAISLIIYLILLRKFNRHAAQNTVLSVAQPTTQNTEVVYVTEPKQEVERVLTGISLDLGVVQRDFIVGDEFVCSGLIVLAEYNLCPTTESIVDYTVVDDVTYTRLAKQNKTHGVYVIRPYMYIAGKKVVTVRYEEQTAAYTISVEEPYPVVEEKPVVVEKPIVVEKPVIVEKPIVVEKVVEKVVVEENSVEAGRLRYDKSFEARLIQSDDEVKHWYTEIKNLLLSYKTCKSRISWKRETFKANKQVVAMLVYRGKKLCLFLSLKPSEYVNEKYDTEDASDTPIYAETPVMIRLKNEKRVKIAKELIETVMKQKKVVPNPYYISDDFYVPYEGILELINKGLIKREIKTSSEEAIFDRGKNYDDD